MLPFMKLVACAVLLCAGGLPLLHAGDADKDAERMQGTWLVVSLTEEGKAVPADEIAVHEIAISKDKLVVTEKGEIVRSYQFKLDPAKKPTAIDFTHLIGDDKGKTELGIYALDIDKLSICLDEKKQGRPISFDAKDTLQCSVIVLKRKPAKDAK